MPRPHTHTKCGLRFPPQYHISYTWGHFLSPLYINVSSRRYVPWQANNNLGLSPFKGQQPSPCSPIRTRDQFSSLSLRITGATPQYPVCIVTAATSLVTGKRQFESRQRQIFFSSPQQPDRPCELSSLLCNIPDGTAPSDEVKNTWNSTSNHQYA